MVATSCRNVSNEAQIFQTDKCRSASSCRRCRTKTPPRGRCPAWYRWQEGQVVLAVANKNFDEDKTRVHSLP